MNALKAKEFYRRDVQYIVRDGKALIINEVLFSIILFIFNIMLFLFTHHFFFLNLSFASICPLFFLTFSL